MKRILLAGTWDTKNDELAFMAGVIEAQGGAVLSMDVSVLGEPRGALDLLADRTGVRRHLCMHQALGQQHDAHHDERHESHGNSNSGFRRS